VARELALLFSADEIRLVTKPVRQIDVEQWHHAQLAREAIRISFVTFSKSVGSESIMGWGLTRESEVESRLVWTCLSGPCVAQVSSRSWPWPALSSSMVRRTATCAVIGLLGIATPSQAQIRGETLLEGSRHPVAVVADPTDRSILLVVEQEGLVRVARDGRFLPEPFLDLRGEIVSGGERGLLGLVVAPDFAESGRFFVNFTNRNGDTVVARFGRHGENPVVAERDSRFDLMWPDGRRFIDQPFSNHKGGHLAIGPDSYLYIGLGDGGSGGDPMNNAQNPRSLLGKMLRIDIGVSDDDVRGYRIPDDNPFLDGDPVAALPEIWAFGLRNPWRYSFDDWTRGGTAALTIADVGQNAREEINFEPSNAGGRNYGWRLREGRQPYDSRTPPAYGPLIEPIHDYSRSIGASVTGGFIYRGAALDPMFNGRYFFADFVSGRVFSLGLHLDPETSEATAADEQEHTSALGGRTTLGMISSFAVDHDGELLVVNYSAGTVVRVAPDLAIVPGAPNLSGQADADRIDLTWEPAEGVPPIAYVVERVRNGAVASREYVERPAARVEWSSGECVRVRGVSRSGPSGPPSAAICAP